VPRKSQKDHSRKATKPRCQGRYIKANQNANKVKRGKKRTLKVKTQEKFPKRVRFAFRSIHKVKGVALSVLKENRKGKNGKGAK